MIARDAGGNERHALFAIDADRRLRARALGRPGAIHVPGAFSPDGARVAFTHTGRNGVDFDVAVVAVAGGERSELAQPGGWSHVTDWSEHGILVQRANTPFDHDLFLVDPESGELDASHPARRRGRGTTRPGCCPTARCCARATRAASSRAWPCCATAPSPSS